MPLRAPIACLALVTGLFWVGAAVSQEPPADTEERSETTASTPAAPTPAPASSDDSPLDYEASEQISEDLSVSFPVDI